MSDNTELPKIIWFLWLQGIHNAPIVVKKCYDSWLKHNPDWKVIFLDESNFSEYAVVSAQILTKQAFSDILRINLLAKHGGVWVDATCYCTKPLDTWLPEQMQSGFFAFNRPGPDRMISSWFMASATNNYFTNAFHKAVEQYWDRNRNMVYIENSKRKILKKYLRRLSPQAWLHPLIGKVLNVHPYFWFHYLFESVYLNDIKARQLWDSTPKISADIPHALQFVGLFNQLTDITKDNIDNQTAPCYKLVWNYPPENLKTGTVLDYLLNTSSL